jgi:ABC-type antimicrobial peptide transport system permease subunit
MMRIATYLLGIPFWLTLVLGALALLLTLSGLFSVLSYLVEQRGKEIGVRMALGANARAIRMLVFSSTFRPVGAGLMIGTGLALALAIVLRSISAEISSIVKVLDPVAYALSLTVIVSACAVAALLPAQKAGRVDPIASLRRD